MAGSSCAPAFWINEVIDLEVAHFHSTFIADKLLSILSAGHRAGQFRKLYANWCGGREEARPHRNQPRVPATSKSDENRSEPNGVRPISRSFFVRTSGAMPKSEFAVTDPII